MKQIITIQHTQSIHHTNGMVGSWTDWALTETGEAQAHRIGERLRAELDDAPYVLYASDLKRAAQTAEIVGGHLGLTPVLRRELRERNLGKCCGQSVAWLRANLEQEERTVDDRLFSDAESRRDAWNRLRPFFDEMMANDAEHIIIVSHGDLLSAFFTMFQGLPVEAMDTCDLFGLAGGVSFLSVGGDGRRRIRRISDLSYIR